MENRGVSGLHHPTPGWENSVHDSRVSLEARQQSDKRAALQIVRNEEARNKDCTNPLQPKCAWRCRLFTPSVRLRRAYRYRRFRWCIRASSLGEDFLTAISGPNAGYVGGLIKATIALRAAEAIAAA